MPETTTLLTAAGEDLETMPREQLKALIEQLQGFMRTMTQTLDEIVEQRDAALLLNELCHY